MLWCIAMVVESVGEGVERIKAGGHVVPIFNGECSNCKYCKYRVNPLKGPMTVDGNGKTRFFVAGREDGNLVPVYHFLNTSTFADYAVLDSACAVKINPMAPLDKMCLFSCGTSTGIGAAWNTANVKEDSTVVIFGLGSLGLAVIKEMTDGGVDYSFECTGNLGVQEPALDLVAKNNTP
ncbi:hypothetical protein LUZ63_013394 [Rhynchospora breviuscula]|uniref:Uncharacterized protein n=1 Tax=Rhynchospora breviuscula TaxID=2022672 RepID=A0A9Q0C8T7_9POAL|nr:hypothetical protein LUZ63_013394 [Rhynchospora breviuscula]